MLTKNKRKINIPLLLSSILLIVVLFSLCFTSGILAKYVNSANSSDNARVAKFSVAVENTDNTSGVVTFTQKTDGTFESTERAYNFTVKNTSEVAVRYRVELVFPTGTSKYLKVTREGFEGDLPWVEGEDKIVFDGKDLAAGETSESEVLSFAITDHYVGATPSETNTLMFEEDIDFDVVVTLIQID